MGSSGSGRFGTYRNTGTGSSGTGSGVNGGTNEIECPAIIENIRLEDVATSDYYVNYNSLPSYGDSIYLNNTIYKGRLVVKAISTDEIIGNLPTRYNFLINCLKKGMHYKGFVVASGITPIPFVVVTLHE